MQPTGSSAYRIRHSYDHGIASGLLRQSVEVTRYI
jgi:hypothetical protein